MRIGPLSRPRGRHARPGATSQPLLAGVLAVSVGGGTLGLAATASAGESAEAVVLVEAAAVPDPEAAAQARAAVEEARALQRTSRERTRQAAAARAAAEAAAQAAAQAAAPAAADPLPGCRGGDTRQYANGRIPGSALCDLPGHPGHQLRADAARAFVRLSRAYESSTGREVCITDSYRSYRAQAALRAQKGRLAARPGTSEHGTGTAVDFCGGVESFGTAAHRWMRANAPRFGWVIPRWARQGGSKPEPWHWEYRG